MTIITDEMVTRFCQECRVLDSDSQPIQDSVRKGLDFALNGPRPMPLPEIAVTQEMVEAARNEFPIGNGAQCKHSNWESFIRAAYRAMHAKRPGHDGIGSLHKRKTDPNWTGSICHRRSTDPR
jgi:hypothetical protein